MEEVYVIRLRGVPSTSTSSSSSTLDTNDLIRGTSLGLGILHLIFGILVLTFGALRTTSLEHEPTETIFGTLFGPVFLATGISAVLSWRRPFRKLKMKVFFCLSSVSLLGSASFLALCFLGLVYYHSVPRVFGDTAHVTANAVVASVGEAVISVLSVLTSGSAMWKSWRCGNAAAHRPSRQKVIVKTDIVGGQSPPDMEGGGGILDDELIRHVSPHCVISLRATDEQRDVIKKVQQYLHSQDELSFTFSDPSTLHEEQDLGVDSQNWRNEVLSVATNPNADNNRDSDYGTKSESDDQVTEHSDSKSVTYDEKVNEDSLLPRKEL